MEIIVPAALSLLSSTADPTPYTAWNSGTAYVADDYVSVSNFTAHVRYKAAVENTSKSPESTTGYWTSLGAVPVWDGTTKWLKGQRAYLATGTDGHTEYKAKYDNVNKAPASNPTYWELVGDILLWSSATAYATNDSVLTVRDLPDREYRAVASNTNKFPPDNSDVWFEAGVSNPYKILDSATTSQTTGEESLTMSFRVDGPMERLALINLTNVLSAIIEVVYNDTVVYSDTVSTLASSTSASWTEYFFGEIESVNNKIIVIPGWYDSGVVNLTLSTNTGEQLGCGMVVVGQGKYLGMTQYGIDFGIKDYSRKTTNEWGDTTLVRRSFAKTTRCTLEVDEGQLSKVYKVLSSARALPCVYNFNNYEETEDETFISYGFYTDFSTIVENWGSTVCNLEVEELT